MKIDTKKWKKLDTFYVPNTVLSVNYPFKIRLYEDTGTLVLEERYQDTHAAIEFSVKTSEEADFIIERLLCLMTIF